MTKDDAGRLRSRLGSASLTALLAVFAALLGYALWSLRGVRSAGLGDAVLTRLDATGVASPVTAVLMSFRAYDTLLELAVLLVALAGVRSGTFSAGRPALAEPAPVLRVLNRLLVPFLLLFAAYLLWAGSSSVGGAFQAGAVLAAAGVLIALSGEAPQTTPGVARAAISLGVAVFASVAVLTLLAVGTMLALPASLAKAIILTIEAAAMLSIGATLVALLLAGGEAKQ